MFTAISTLSGDNVSTIANNWLTTRDVKVNVTFKRSSTAGIIINTIGY